MRILTYVAAVFLFIVSLTHPGVSWSAEGLVVAIENVAINSDLKPEITFRLEDNKGQPLSIRGEDENEEDVSIRGFILARLEVNEDGTRGTHYMSYTTSIATVPEGEPNAGATALQAGYDSGGVYTDLGGGRYMYTFGTALPPDYDQTLTHTVSGQLERTVNEFRYVANPVHHFVPNGSEVTTLRRVATTESCNKCHNGLGLHGGARMEMQLCILCHTPQSIDPETGNTVEMGTLIHKIHMGEYLPSVQAGNPYQIIGYRQSVHDYSHVKFPQDNRNCTTCHTGPEADVYKTAPSRMACGSCHDDVNFQTGEGHGPGLPQPDDSQCSLCHAPEGNEFDISVTGTHTIPSQSDQLDGLIAEIMEVQNAAPGQTPTVVYSLKDGNGSPIAPTDLRTTAITFSGPVQEYMTYNREDAAAGSVAVGDAYQYTFSNPIDANADESYSFAIEARRNVTLLDNPEGEEDIVATEAAQNPMAFASLSGGTADSRRQIVDVNKCNECHNQISFHGSLRNQLEYCVVCHNPKTSDIGRRPDGVEGGESVNFSYMIHKIHAGHELTKPYVVYGYGSTPHDYSEVLFPGKRQKCSICHIEKMPELPLATEVAAISFTDKGGNQVQIPPMTAACTSCHDDAMDHANQFNQNGAETCHACHGAGMPYDIANFHQDEVGLNVEVTFGDEGGTQVQNWLLQ